jgi:hypothetical protein
MTNLQTIVPTPNNIPYIKAIVVMMCLGVIGIVAITFARPEADNTVIIGALVGLLTPTTFSLLAFMKSQETHASVNSRLDAFMKNAEAVARAEGVNEGRALANARTDALAAPKEPS